jgi:nuclease-like protein
MTQNYIGLLLIVLCFAGIGLPTTLSADSLSSSIDEKPTKYNPESNNTDIEKHDGSFISQHYENMKPTARIYAVQTQPESTNPIPENNLAESSSTNTSDTFRNNGVTSGSGLSSKNNPSADSTGQANLTPKSTTVKCEGIALCVMGEVVKVINAKTLYVNIQNKVYKIELALISLPVNSEQAMRAATTFTRNTCLGSNVLIDQDDGQRQNSFIAQVYCSPTKNLNALLLNTGFVQLDASQCHISEFSNLNWAKLHGC